jgi:SnoaL-like domain
MSQENVELVLRFQPAPEVDLALLFRDDHLWAAMAATLEPFIDSEFECVNPGAPGERTYTGTEGFRSFWLDWLAPWATYRATVGKPVDRGDRVLVLADNFARPVGSTHEVKLSAGSIYVIRDATFVRYEGYLHQADALKAVGLEA